MIQKIESSKKYTLSNIWFELKFLSLGYKANPSKVHKMLGIKTGTKKNARAGGQTVYYVTLLREFFHF